MSGTTLNKVLALTRKLPGDEQDMLVELVRRSRAEQWRKELARYARKAEREFRAGRLKAEKARVLASRLQKEWADTPLHDA